MPPNSSSLLVHIQPPEWKVMPFTANFGDRVNKINEHVQSQTKVPVCNQVLLFDSKTLEPQKTLSSYGIDKETTIYLTLQVVKPNDEELDLTVMEPGEGGLKHHIQVSRSNSGAQVKGKIESNTAVNLNEKFVIYKGKRIEDGKTMGEHGIKGGDTLYVIPKYKGG
ncbi:PREDICTED: ubiquitin D-like [Condylura cristata]|uniref:ubiquitin D-like n=1 Tax=Condylura cristata TaxID=143302 RepID=UPI0003347594|nr:PREDICTED: ubiquitin D-like [Condylura cristata]